MASSFIKNISVSASGSIKLLTESGKENTGTVATGNKVAVYDLSGNLKKTYDIVIYGDVSGDGVVNVKDSMIIRRHIIGRSTLSGAYMEAADTSKDGTINVQDSMIIRNHILGRKNI